MADYIDFISSYCDRWCERCAFTSRCSAYAAEVAIAMCGDVVEGLELAVGRPAPEECRQGVPPDQVPYGPARPADWVTCEQLAQHEVSDEEMREMSRAEDARRARVNESPILKDAWAVSMRGYQWLKDHASALRRAADPVLHEALDVVTHDVFLVTVKLSRAVDGRDRFESGDGRDAHPIQNDWNGSAKVASICLARSFAAWQVIAQASGDAASLQIAEELEALRQHVQQAFPAADRFVRPGFDDRR
jgi:hypothetical protein